MCGIAGVVRLDGGARAQLKRARAMQRALRHRGPDGEGEFVTAEAVLVHTRLALLDRAGGTQPRTTPDGRFTIVFSGEVYNHEEVRRGLAYPFSTRSDVETVLAAYALRGAECLEQLNGMFAFFVWDAATRRGFLARDRLGVKPLAYAWDGEELVFASEASAVARALRGPLRIDEEAVLEYLVAPCFSGVERPMFAGVSYLQPGHWLRVDERGAEVRRYWRFAVARDEEEVPDDEALRGALERSVRRACLADEPLGVFLSGGLDSTAVATYAARERPRLPAYTIVFAGMEAFDYRRSAIVVGNDMDYVGAAVAATGVDWRPVHVPRSELAADLERIAETNDALPAWEQEVAQDRLARAAAADTIKAVLVGDAADETHFGYHFLLDPEATAGPEKIIKRFAGVAVRREVAEDPVAVLADRYRAWIGEGEDEEGRIAATTRLIVERWLPRLLHNGDIHCMRSGVEARVPFADSELLALAARVPPRAGLAGGEKARLRAALRGEIPEEIRARRKSALPKDQLAETVYRQEAGRLLAEPPRLVRELVDLAAMRPLLDPRRALGEWERAGLFRLIELCHFSHHHGIP